MCTLSIVASSGDSRHIRLVCNRDERRTRAPSTPPALHTLGERSCLMPVDPDSGGSWIGVSDVALAACLLNANPAGATATRTGLRSRGEIVPMILRASDLAEAASLAANIDPHQYPQFSLFIVQAVAGGSMWCEARPGAGGMTVSAPATFDVPIMATSSSLGDDRVRPRRTALFDSIVRADVGDPLEAQHAFHRHSWPGLESLSVLMRRPEARTVSRTQVDLLSGRAVMRYWSLDELGEPTSDHSQHELLLRVCDALRG
jgi:hypothetical protein